MVQRGKQILGYQNSKREVLRKVLPVYSKLKMISEKWRMDMDMDMNWRTVKGTEKQKKNDYICKWRKETGWEIIKKPKNEKLIKEKPIKKKPPLYNDNPNFRKTLCKKWKRSRHCPYGVKCQFAHGKEEIGTKLDEYEHFWRMIQIEVFSGKH